MEATLRAANLEYIANEFATLTRIVHLKSAPLVAAIVRDLHREACVPIRAK